MDRGKVMTDGRSRFRRDFGRYLDVDGDGIPLRTYPGTHPTQAARSSPAAPRATPMRATPRKAAAYVENMQRLLRKFETAKTFVPAPLVDATPAAARGSA